MADYLIAGLLILAAFLISLGHPTNLEAIIASLAILVAMLYLRTSKARP